MTSREVAARGPRVQAAAPLDRLSSLDSQARAPLGSDVRPAGAIADAVARRGPVGAAVPQAAVGLEGLSPVDRQGLPPPGTLLVPRTAWTAGADGPGDAAAAEPAPSTHTPTVQARTSNPRSGLTQRRRFMTILS